ncbi:hypothetical protein K8Z61_16175 [Nocardioides sp. TRM66260-LWL]|uniref:hypothetical protein n=1 Tax=Nocardioides sp. TRM66260-LWL TaxID=2874478 RepID=UPI001CC6D703|nr:hypothetical protein [Nocardioides sp. TRM66260-LWL]MBZ5736032.1 hypothetical protein [Nocardioides sp. TRM66260-LWL]
MKKTGMRIAALGGAAALLMTAAGPGYSATTVSQASATALQLSIAGSGFDTGTVAAKNFGKGEEKTGEVNPPISILKNQALAGIGVLAQDATATVESKDGVSAACSGVAGRGGSVVNVGDSGCLKAGNNVDLNFINLDLSKALTIDPNSALGPLAQANPVVQQLLGAILTPLTQALQNSPLGTLNVSLGAGVIEAVCSARPGTATGSANIVDAGLNASFGGQSVKLVNLPVKPAPNTQVVTDLDQVVNNVLDGLSVQLKTALNGVLDPLNVLTDALKTQIVDTIVKPVADQLKPLEDNVLKITLNEQSSKEKGQITVTALDLQVLPAAKQFVGSSLIEGKIATVNCGPNTRVTTPDPNPTPTPSPSPTPGPGPKPTPPTVIDAGENGSTPWGAGLAGLMALTLGGAAGIATQRRLATRK